MTRRIIHLSIAKWLLIELLTEHGASAVLNGWEGTDAEAYEAITADPHEYHVMDDTCDKRGPDGSCLGHEVV